MAPKTIVIVCLVLAALGCGMSDQELKDRTGDAAVAAKRAAENAGDTMKDAYNEAAVKGKEAMKTAGENLSDATLKAKMLAGFKLVKGLDVRNVTVEAKDGMVKLSGTVPSRMDKMKAEGVAYGVTGDSAKFTSTIEVK